MYLERLSVATFAESNLIQCRKIRNDSKLKFLLKKGNEGLLASKPHTCSLCQKVFKNRFTFKDHLETFHLKTTKMFCDLCSKIYFSIKTIRHHMRSIHWTKKFTCNICEYKTAKRCHLQKHKLIHATKVECPICHKQVALLKDHIGTHEPKERCLICNKMYIKRNVSAHMKVHGRKACKCERCEQAFDNKEHLRR